MSITLIASAVGSGSTNGQTTGSINTTGATLLVIAGAYYAAVGAPTSSDSKGNTWTDLLQAESTDPVTRARLSVCAHPTSVGSGHTASLLGTGSFAACVFAAFSGTLDATTADVNVAAGGFGSTIQPGSGTPAHDGELILTAAGWDVSTPTPAVNESFTIIRSEDFSGGASFGVSLAWLAQMTAAALNPTWTLTSGNDTAAVMASFRGASGAPPPSNRGIAEFIGAFL